MRPRRLFLIITLAALQAGCLLPDIRAPEEPTPPGSHGLRGPLLRVDVVDVGQGDAVLVRTPAGKTLLFDAGPRQRAEDLVEHLREVGVTRIDALVLSHAHEDHYGGALPIIESFPVELAYEPGLRSDRAPWRATIQALESRNIPVLTSWIFAAGERIIPDEPALNATILWPYGIRQDQEPAQQGIVLRIQYGNFSLLLPGDINAATERRLIQDGLGRTTIVLAPHHGSAHSSSDALISTARPEAVIFSAGAGNEYGHPAAETVARWERTGARILRTDEVGTVSLVTDGTTWRIG